MGVFLSHATALGVLRRWELSQRLARGERCDAPVPPAVPKRAEVRELKARVTALAAASEPLELIVSAGRPGPRASGVLVHLDRAPLPLASALRLSEDVVCAAPELVAVQMAPSLTDLELTVLLSELLGVYAICPEAQDGMFQRREPLTTPERMLAYLDALGPRPGTALVRRALSRACVRSGSPRETKLALRLSLRPGLGGWGLNVISMNEPLVVRRIGRAFAEGVRKPDILIGPAPREGAVDLTRLVAIEYNGGRHRDPARVVQDATRHNELKGRGIPEYVIWKEHYDDLDYMDGIVERVRADLGLPRIGMTRETARKRRELRQMLYEELELIDGIHWRGRERAGSAPLGSTPPEQDLVPVEAYGV